MVSRTPAHPNSEETNSEVRAYVRQRAMTSGHNFTIARVIARLNIGGPAIQAILITDVFRQKGYRTLLLTGKVPAGEGSIEYWTLDMDIVPIKIGTMSRRISWYKDLTTLWQLVRILISRKTGCPPYSHREERHARPTVTRRGF